MTFIELLQQHLGFKESSANVLDFVALGFGPTKIAVRLCMPREEVKALLKELRADLEMDTPQMVATFGRLKMLHEPVSYVLMTGGEFPSGPLPSGAI